MTTTTKTIESSIYNYIDYCYKFERIDLKSKIHVKTKTINLRIIYYYKNSKESLSKHSTGGTLFKKSRK